MSITDFAYLLCSASGCAVVPVVVAVFEAGIILLGHGSYPTAEKLGKVTK